MAALPRSKRKKALPKIEGLPGAVCAQWKRCGRPGCRCAGGFLHGPYYYRFWREAGRLHKQYLKPNEVETVRASCTVYGTEKRRLRTERVESMKMIREAIQWLRMLPEWKK